MSLFDAAVEQVVKDVGKENIVAVNDRNLADYCKIWMLVVRKQHTFHWPWKSKFEYVPTEVMLGDILTEPLPDMVSLESTSTLFQHYQCAPSFSKSGKTGGKFASQVSLDASVSETLQVVMKLGNITKKEILWEKLYEAIKQHQAKPDHPLVKIIKNRKTKRRRLYVIGMTILAGKEELGLTAEFTETVDGSATVHPNVALNLGESEDKKQHTQFDIPAGTCLAYSCDEITIDRNGVVSLQLQDDVRK